MIKYKKTILKKLKNWVIFSFVFAIMLNSMLLHNIVYSYGEENTQSFPAPPDIFAQAGVLIEASTGTVLYNKCANDQMYPASITKILTTLLALEEGNLTDMVEFSHYDVYSLEPGDAHISMNEGELLSLNDCLYGIMLASANEVSNAVAEYVAKKTPAYTNKIEELKKSGETYDESKVAINVFADMMNARATKAGALNSHFANPNGLFMENHYTTCYDMAMITRDAIKNEQFLKIESNTTYIIPTTNLTTETRGVANRHKMMFPLNSVYYEGILGGKTGYVDQSGNTLVTFAKRNGMTLISVVMKSNSENVYKDTRLLLDYGFNNFSVSNISESETKFSLNNTGFLSSFDTIFPSGNSLIKINSEDNIVLPNGVNLSDCKSELSFADSNSTDSFATLKYFYGNTCVGNTTLSINKDNNNDFEFGPAKESEETKSESKKDIITIDIRMLVGVILVIIIIILAVLYLKSTRPSRIRRKRRKQLRKNKNYGTRRPSNRKRRIK